MSEDKNPFDELDDKQVLQKLEDGAFMEDFAKSENWMLFRQGCEALGRKAAHRLTTIDPLKDPTGVIEAQIITKFCRNVLRSIVEGIRNEGRLAFDEAKRRKIKISNIDDKHNA